MSGTLAPTRPTAENAATRRIDENRPCFAEVFGPRQTLLNLAADRHAIVADARAHGCDLDRWARRDRLALAAAITRAEDRLESEHPSAARLARRVTLREVRRDLEAA